LNMDDNEMYEQFFSLSTPPQSPNSARSLSPTSSSSCDSITSVWDGCNNQQDWSALHLR
ncbi:unnamed protein product, partial [Didymodactylos carnosus]